MSPGSRKAVGIELAPGQVFAERYEITGRAGQGSSAVVYAARDLLTGQSLALKVLRPAACQNRRVMAQFQRDVELLRTISHPSLVRIHGTAEEGGVFYVVLEFVDGIAVEQRLRQQRPRRLDEALRVFRQVCGAASVLHARNLVHGDINPRNVMLGRDGEATLLEFGLSRDLRQSVLGDPTRTGDCRAPEQLLGRTATCASDVYSLGCLAFALITGKPVHAGVATTDRCTAPPPSFRSEAPQTPAPIALILERCLEPAPEERFSNAAELAAAFDAAWEEASRGAPRRPSLAEHFGEDPAHPKTVLRAIAGLCARLREIHAEGLSHPPLSPSAIAIDDCGDVEVPSHPTPPENATMMIAEPKYAAPEQLLGRASPEDRAHIAGDVYVLGFLAYEAIVGRKQFRRQFSGLVESDLGWMSWHADPARRLRPLAEAAPECPHAVSELIGQMVEKDPARRVQTLQDVEAALGRMSGLFETTEQFSIGAPPLSPAAPAAPPSRRRRWLSAAGIAAGVLAVAAAWALGRTVELRPLIARLTGQEPGLAHAPAEALPSTIETAAGPMILILGGSYVIGNDAVVNQSPMHSVKLPAFYLDRLEVTNARYEQFCNRSGRPLPRAPAWDAGYLSKPEYPVVNVSWADAKSFCEAAGKRLPAEQEWEAAARGGPAASLRWANFVIPGLANLQGSGPGTPSAAGSFAADASPQGLMDMAGNVHEWLADDYRMYDGNPAAIPAGEAGHKVVRGGSFALRPEGLSPAWRASLAPDLPAEGDLPVGFRCAAAVDAALKLRIR